MNAPTTDPALWAATLIHSRHSTLPKRLQGPGPSPAERAAILQAAAAAPDHEQLLPWRFVEIPRARRADLGAAFAQALLERDPAAGADERAQARDKAQRAPWLLLAVVRTGGPPAHIGAGERLLSAGAAIQNMLLMATALGLGSGLTSGQAMGSAALRTLFRLTPDEEALCFVAFGQISANRPAKARPEGARYFQTMD